MANVDGSGSARKSTSTTATAAASGTTPHTHPVPIKDLETKFGWKPDSWQHQLLTDADAAGKKDGKVSVAELEKYLANPKDLKFVNSENLQKMRADMGTGAAPRSTDAFKPGWERNLAKAADANKDNHLSPEEFNAFVSQMKQRTDTHEAGSTWLPDQKQAAFSSRIAASTGEVDRLAPDGPLKDGKDLFKEYMRIATSDGHRVPQWVAYQLDAADIRETPETVTRKGDKSNPIPAYRKANPFHQDPDDGPGAVDDKEYEGSGFDQGHMKPAESSPSQEAMYESFLMSNMSTQHGALNQNTWRYLEDGVHELVQATGGKATIITGNAFLDEKGNPLPEDKIPYFTEKDGHRLAVPTHCFKTVLLEQPDGQVTMMAYLVPNDPNLSRKQDDGVKLLQQSRVSVDQIEKIIGHDLYSQLPKATQAKLEADP